MNTTTILLFFTVVWFACSRAPVKEPDTPSTPPVSIDGTYIKATIVGFNEANSKLVATAVDKANEVVKSECFKDFMLKRELKETGERSNAQVVEVLTSTTENVVLKYYYTAKLFTSASAYGYAKDNIIYINWAYYSGWTTCDRASGIAHETSHKSGFTHDFNRTKDRDLTVPYSINAAFKACCK